MYHNLARLMKLEPWIRLIEWYLLGGIGLRILGMVAISAGFMINPDKMNGYAGGRNIYLFMSGLALKNITGILIPLFFYLLFLGISHTTHYLLALKDTLEKA
jgi:hypothetical protein